MSKARGTKEQDVRSLQQTHLHLTSIWPLVPSALLEPKYTSGNHISGGRGELSLILVATATIPVARESMCYKFDGEGGKKKKNEEKHIKATLFLTY